MSSTVGLFAGRLALVTGAGSGIGRSVCKALALQGARLAAVDMNEKGLEPVLGLPGGNHKTFVVDVSNSTSVTNLMKDIESSFNQTPDWAVNCAGIVRDKLLLKMTEEDFDKVIAVNLKGTFLVSQAVARGIVAKKLKNGSIVNISSMAGKTGNVGQANYSATKAGVVAMTKTFAKELSRYNIRCNVVLPGFIETPIIQGVPEKVMELAKLQIPLARLGKPEEVAEVISFLLSDDASYITGAALEISGGLWM